MIIILLDKQDVNHFLPPARKTENAVTQPNVANKGKTTQTVSM